MLYFQRNPPGVKTVQRPIETNWGVRCHNLPFLVNFMEIAPLKIPWVQLWFHHKHEEYNTQVISHTHIYIYILLNIYNIHIKDGQPSKTCIYTLLYIHTYIIIYICIQQNIYVLDLHTLWPTIVQVSLNPPKAIGESLMACKWGFPTARLWFNTQCTNGSVSPFNLQLSFSETAHVTGG